MRGHFSPLPPLMRNRSSLTRVLDPVGFRKFRGPGIVVNRVGTRNLGIAIPAIPVVNDRRDARTAKEKGPPVKKKNDVAHKTNGG